VSLQAAHNAILKALGKDEEGGWVIYDFRHTAATRWAEDRVPLPTIAAWLGHANLRSIQKYIHLSQQHLDEEAKRYEERQAAKRVEQAPAVQPGAGRVQ
jgi:integrase